MPFQNSDDLQTILVEQDMLQYKIRRRKLMELTLKLYAFAGVIVAVFGLFYVAYILLDLNVSPKVQMGLLLTFSGTVMAIASLFGISYIRDRNERSVSEKSVELEQLMLVHLWIKFERTARSVSNLNKDDPQYFSVRRLLEILRKDEKIGEGEFRALQTALELRNRFVHGVDSGSIDPAEVQYVSEVLEKIVSRLEHGRDDEEHELLSLR